MGYRCFEVDVSNRVAHVRLSRPDELNSMVPEFWRELPEIVQSISDSGESRALVLSSTGRHFSAGMDLSVFAGGLGIAGDGEPARRSATFRSTVLRLQQTFTVFEKARIPVLVAIQGGCIGGAVDLACAADMRYASSDAFFVVQETNIGMVADLGTLQRLPKLIPDGVARELVYTGRRMPAVRAAEVGLVNQVFPDHDSLVSGVLEIATEIAAKSPLVTWGNKESLLYARDHSVADSLDFIASWQMGALQPTDMTEAFTAKGERRDPVFEDLPPAPTGL
ncbi:MAG TPA: crotonase/enoyl-CoA hydratase family protein [Frankiaceae bacterium]|nr:crotonase/enoyl-CoA hydratase family protein [Frankiaceae bacterium]